MIDMNYKMLKAYEKLSIDQDGLIPKLIKLAHSGFKCRDKCFFLKGLIKRTNVTVEDFPDKTGYECFINSLHVDDYIEKDHLTQGILFVKEVFKYWNLLNKKNKLIAILSFHENDDPDVNVKFHVERPGEHWIMDDLNEYEAAVMIVDSSESTFQL